MTLTVSMPFAENLKRIMSQKDVDQSELARRLGVSPQAVNQWASGVTAPRGKRFAKVAEALEVDPADLWTPGVATVGLTSPTASLQAQRLEAARLAGWESLAVAADALEVEPEWLLAVEAGHVPLEAAFILKFCAEAECPIGWIQRADMAGMKPEMSARIGYSRPHLVRGLLTDGEPGDEL